MKISSLLFFLCFPLWAVAQIDGLPANYKFLALGDSYTVGTSVSYYKRWPWQLKDSLEQRGISNDTVLYIAQRGWRTDELIAAVQNANYPNDFDLVSLLIGVNNQYQNGNLNTFKIEFNQLLQLAIQKAGGDKNKLIVLSIPDYAFTPFGQNSGNPGQISAEIDIFNMVKESVCDSLGISYFYITDISRQGLNIPAMVATDNLHPSGFQYSLWVKRIINRTLASNINIDQVNKTEFWFNCRSGYLILSSDVEELKIYDLKGSIIRIIKEDNYLTLPDGFYIFQSKNKNGDYRRKKIFVN